MITVNADDIRGVAWQYPVKMGVLRAEKSRK
jgi:hypothetical protein